MTDEELLAASWGDWSMDRPYPRGLRNNTEQNEDFFMTTSEGAQQQASNNQRQFWQPGSYPQPQQSTFQTASFVGSHLPPTANNHSQQTRPFDSRLAPTGVAQLHSQQSRPSDSRLETSELSFPVNELSMLDAEPFSDYNTVFGSSDSFNNNNAHNFTNHTTDGQADNFLFSGFGHQPGHQPDLAMDQPDWVAAQAQHTLAAEEDEVPSNAELLREFGTPAQHGTPAQQGTLALDEVTAEDEVDDEDEVDAEDEVTAEGEQAAQDGVAAHDQVPAQAAATSGVNAVAVAAQTNSGIPDEGADGLRFDSRAAASATMDRIFRFKLEKVKRDDVDEVEHDARKHVKLLLTALKRIEYLPCPDERRVAKRKTETTSPEAREAWKVWQEGAQKVVQTHRDQPHADARLELRAWEVFEEIVNVHKIGYSCTNMTKNAKSKCSERITLAVTALTDYAIVRQKILNNDKISEFAYNPKAYADTTVRSHINNWGRAETKAAREGNETKKSKPDGRRGAVPNGAVAKRYAHAKEVIKRKRTAAKEEEAKGKGKGKAKVTKDKGRAAAEPENPDDEQDDKQLEGSNDAHAAGEDDEQQEPDNSDADGSADDSDPTPLADEPSSSMPERRRSVRHRELASDDDAEKAPMPTLNLNGDDDTSAGMYESTEEDASDGYDEDIGYDEDDGYSEDDGSSEEDNVQEASSSPYRPTAAPARKRRRY